MPAQTTAKERFDQRAAGPHCARDDHRERERSRGDAGDGQQADAEQRGERVVERAVGDEAVAARVPEVVPEREAAIVEQGALVHVRREVGAGWAEPRQEAREGRCDHSSEGCLAGDRVGRADDCCAHVGWCGWGRRTEPRLDPIAGCPVGSCRPVSARQVASSPVSTSYWLAESRGPILAAELDGSPDVVVVGAGVTGCSAALVLARAGLRVRVHDAREIAGGASGRNGGFALRGGAAPVRRDRRLGRP